MTLVPAKDYSSIESMLEINLIALKNGAARRKQVVEVDIPALASYGPCVRAGELVFPSGLMALSRDGRVPAADDAAAFDAIGLAGQAQGALIHSYAEAVCKAVGVPMGNVVRARSTSSPTSGILPASRPPGRTATESSRTPLPRCKCPDLCRRAGPPSSATFGSTRDNSSGAILR